MIKTIRPTVIGAAVAVLVVAGLAVFTTPAQADVQRNQIVTNHYTNVVYLVTGNSTPHPQTADITTNPCNGTFGGPGTNPIWGATSTSGHFDGPNHAVYTVTYTVNGQTDYTVWGEVTVNGDGSFAGTWFDNLGGVVGAETGTVSSGPPSSQTSTSYANHGQYVKANGGHDDAAHSCIGMPVQSHK